MARGPHCRFFTLLLFIVVACGLMGCSRGGSEPAAGAARETAAARPDDPAAQVAYDFLDAVLRGDTQQASAQLTPMALERIIASGKQFAPPGLDTASFRIGEVRLPSESQALVQCFLIDDSSRDAPRTEEMCCLVRRVEGHWRISGIAYSAGPDQPPVILDFEHVQQAADPQHTATADPGDGYQSAADAPRVSRPSPRPSTQEPAGTVVR